MIIGHNMKGEFKIVNARPILSIFDIDPGLHKDIGNL